jgi:hypothetical protein
LHFKQSGDTKEQANFKKLKIYKIKKLQRAKMNLLVKKEKNFCSTGV